MSVTAAVEREFPPSSMHDGARARFLAKVAPVDDDTSCWEWRGYRESELRHGLRRSLAYGVFTMGRGQLRKAHRVAWEMANARAIPPALVVMHRCDNAACVRPSHLAIGTHADNNADMDAKGRRVLPPRLRGEEKVKQHKVREVDIPTIRALHAAKELTTAQIAARYGVSRSLISLIGTRRVWAHVPDAPGVA